ncbi:hypothetical protein GCG54_00010943 [Colletotrichum gloeosporioides]|uniref:Uncharacterized protein n=1 Tax=Colletotrichum gloeosporioides TaxID=474922 RepID=A0A8H4CS10_COLGL|nr:uncharacterized protein GCG54_00010943 [Colletotrichum gloeosporioides]KAF3808752.1 hypothetical protein GCG54_00010943 [Colletotrichum gloeosporioides]
MVDCLPIKGMVGGLIYLGVCNKTSNWAWMAGLMRNRNEPEILAEFLQIKQTIELESQLSQRSSWKSLVSLVIGTMVIAASFATLAILQQRIEATNEAASAKGTVAVCFVFYWAAFSSYTQRARGVGVGQALHVGYQ